MSVALIVIISVLGTVVVAGTTLIMAHVVRKTSKESEESRTNTITDEFIDNPIMPGVYGFMGPQGVGKTSLMYAMLSVDFQYHGNERIEIGRRDIEHLNSIVQKRPYKLKMPDCAYRTRHTVILPNGKKTYHTDISQFGLPGKPGVQYFPKGTVLAFEEIDSYMNCRKWNDDKQDIIDGLKYTRHNDMVIMWDAQKIDRVDKAVRDLTTDLLIVESKQEIWKTTVSKYLKRRRRVFTGTEWTFLWIKKQLLDNVSSLCGLGYKVDTTQYIRRCKFFYKGDIYKQYNSKSGKAYWLNGIENYYVEEHHDNDFSREGIEEFVKRNALYKEEDEESKAV